LFLALLLGFASFVCTAQMAVTPDRVWQVPASMLSELNPDDALDTDGRRIEPLRVEVLTPWDPGKLLTPVGTVVVVPLATFVPPLTDTVTPQKVSAVPTPSPDATLHPRPFTATPTPASVLLPTIAIEAEWPMRMDINRSDSIRLSLVRAADDESVPIIEAASHTVVAATLVPVEGTPEVSIQKAFGPGYVASAVARLEGTAFEISPVETDYQSLDQPRITWRWDILALELGRQAIDACVVVRWEFADGTGEAIERTIWCSPLEILVE
jgi:hypothetical protein